MAVKITPGNVDDRATLALIIKGLQGKCYADKGCIGKVIFTKLSENRL